MDELDYAACYKRMLDLDTENVSLLERIEKLEANRKTMLMGTKATVAHSRRVSSDVVQYLESVEGNLAGMEDQDG